RRATSSSHCASGWRRSKPAWPSSRRNSASRHPTAAPADPSPAMNLDALRGQLAAAKDRLLQRDVARLDTQLVRARLPRFDVARFERDLQQAVLRAENRQRLRPARIDYPAELPVS